MSLSCDCGDGGDIFWDEARDVKRFRKPWKCQACGDDLKNKPGYELPLYSYCDEFDEERHCYEPRPSWDRLCEPCGDFYLSLCDLGFCVNDLQNMRTDYEEYKADRRERELADAHGLRVNHYPLIYPAGKVGVDPKPFEPVSL